MGVKVVFPFLLLVVSFSYVTMYNPFNDTTRVCSKELLNKLRTDKVACSCRKDYVHGFFIVNCYGYSKKHFHDIRPVLRNTFNKSNELKLSFKQFPQFNMSSNYFEGFNISSLEFRECKIKNISDGDLQPAFVGLEDTLEYLEIYNSLKSPVRKERDEPAPCTLGHLRRLREAKITNNELWRIDNNMFAGGPKSLEILDLMFDSIYDLDDRAFADLSNLKVLKMGSNRLREYALKRSTFPNPALHLEKLFLQSNLLTKLPIDMFDNMPSLHTVELHVNQISNMPERTWMPIWSHLEELNIIGNSLICKEKMTWLFKARKLWRLYGECWSPPEWSGEDLKIVQEEMKKRLKDES